MTRTTLFVLLGVILVGGVCCLGFTPFGFFAEAAFYFAVGWAIYPFRLLRDAEINWRDLGVICGSLFLLTVGLHFFCRWIAQSRQTDWTWRYTLGIVAAVMLITVAGISAVGVTHQAVWLTTSKEQLVEGGLRTIAGRVQSANNMKNIAIAAHGFHDANQHLPAGGIFDAQGRGLHGWQTSILPYIDQNPLFQKIDLNQPWNSPRNVAAMKTEVNVYLHPSIEKRATSDYALGHYAGNSHVLGVKPLPLKEITDGTSNTILLGEVAASFKPWGMPMNCRDPMIGLNAADGFASPEGKAVQLAFADGTVRAIRPDISPAVLKAISTPRGGEQVNLDELDR